MKIIEKSTFAEFDGNPNNFSEKYFVKYDGIIPDCDNKYKKWNSDYTLISEMSESEKIAVDIELIHTAKSNKTAELSKAATDYIDNEYPTYKQVNAALGIYDSDTITAVKNRITAARNEYYTKKALVDLAGTIESVNKIEFTLKLTAGTPDYTE